jgi:hypothetical protein
MTENRLPSQGRYIAMASRCEQLADAARTEVERVDYLQRASLWRKLGAARLPEGSQQSPFPNRTGPGKGHGRRTKNATDAVVSQKKPRQRLGAGRGLPSSFRLERSAGATLRGVMPQQCDLPIVNSQERSNTPSWDTGRIGSMANDGIRCVRCLAAMEPQPAAAGSQRHVCPSCGKVALFLIRDLSEPALALAATPKTPASGGKVGR